MLLGFFDEYDKVEMDRNIFSKEIELRIEIIIQSVVYAYCRNSFKYENDGN